MKQLASKRITPGERQSERTQVFHRAELQKDRGSLPDG